MKKNGYYTVTIYQYCPTKFLCESQEVIFKKVISLK